MRPCQVQLSQQCGKHRSILCRKRRQVRQASRRNVARRIRSARTAKCRALRRSPPAKASGVSASARRSCPHGLSLGDVSAGSRGPAAAGSLAAIFQLQTVISAFGSVGGTRPAVPHNAGMARPQPNSGGVRIPGSGRSEGTPEIAGDVTDAVFGVARVSHTPSTMLQQASKPPVSHLRCKVLIVTSADGKAVQTP